ncbi:MAG: hypothetical protein PHQ72_14250 [Hespellia sp.]|nr:hypothetical protein [Hespellia sp.]
MGFSDFLKNAADKTTQMVKSEMDKKAETKQYIAEQSKLVSVSFQINNGFQQVNGSSTSTMFQRCDGTIYFNNNFYDRFIFTDYIWSGPRFETNTVSSTNIDSRETTKGKSGKMAAGAVIGTFLLPGVGTAVGAAVGAGGKKKKIKKNNLQQIARKNK